MRYVDAAKLLREARSAAGLTQRELAERAGVPQPAIARIESGGISPRIHSLERLLAACGRTLVLDEPRVDPDDWREVLKNLRLTPEERLAKLDTRARYESARRLASRGDRRPS